MLTIVTVHVVEGDQRASSTKPVYTLGANDAFEYVALTACDAYEEAVDKLIMGDRDDAEPAPNWWQNIVENFGHWLRAFGTTPRKAA